MPKKIPACHKHEAKGRFLHICYPPGGGAGVAGYLHPNKHEAHIGARLTKAHLKKQGAHCPLVVRAKVKPKPKKPKKKSVKKKTVKKAKK